jgi:hypothetical protein
MGVRHVVAGSGNGRVEKPWGSVGDHHPLLHCCLILSTPEDWRAGTETSRQLS